MDFKLVALPQELISPFQKMTEAELKSKNAIRMTAGESPAPCRASLALARPGETIYLFNYAHLDVDSPYASRHAIFMRESAEEWEPEPNKVPGFMRVSPLSVRAFNADNMIVDVDVTLGDQLEPALKRMLTNENVSFVHMHYAGPGCYAARVERAN